MTKRDRKKNTQGVMKKETPKGLSRPDGGAFIARYKRVTHAHLPVTYI